MVVGAVTFGAALALADPVWDPVRCACLPKRCRAVTIVPAEPLARLRHAVPAGCVRRSQPGTGTRCACVAFGCTRLRLGRFSSKGLRCTRPRPL